ncbi:MAG: hypothetical protein G01um1014106_740 [Parcubacteria group bacterium Gr01-1014_106]|nr:MAG: hypothetical protein G01um1014106_740 [Parcubacteria group bacterium Gr01-1014_106]
MTDGTPEGGFLERLRNSPRTVSTIIVILIVVGAIFAFSDRGEQPAGAPTASPTGALHRALEAQKPDFEVTAEHKVWIEDYVKDHLGRQALAVGQSLPITKELVREGIEKSKSLTDAQRQNLRRYARLVAAYR